MRKVLFWMHLGAGLAASALILFFSITGALLAYERQIVHAADARSYHAVTPPPTAPRLSLDQLLAHAATVISAPLESVTVHPDPHAAIELTTGRRDVYFLDPGACKVRCRRVRGPSLPR